MTTDMRKTALICGVSGQDGAFLAELLLDKGYRVWGTSRDAQISLFSSLVKLGIRDRIELISMAASDFRSVLSALNRTQADEVYFLAAQSSVGLSFEQPVETLESIASGTLNLLEAIRFLDRPVRLYHASSSECFGELDGTPATELTPFRPRSPYAVAKASAHWLVANYREAYGLFGCNGILFNHESGFRPERFVTQKIVSAAVRIAQGSGERLTLGRLDVVRDWGWAPEYVAAMWEMLQQESPDDYIVATGEAHSLADFVEAAFALHGLDWKDHVDTDRSQYRPADIAWSCGNPSRTLALLNWKAQTAMRGVVTKMSEARIEATGTRRRIDDKQ
jgi:GDPmannose 4,6-dehydratase